MPLIYYFKTLRVSKTGSPSVRFYYLLTVCCAYPDVSLRGTIVVIYRDLVVLCDLRSVLPVSSRSTLSGYS